MRFLSAALFLSLFIGAHLYTQSDDLEMSWPVGSTEPGELFLVEPPGESNTLDRATRRDKTGASASPSTVICFFRLCGSYRYNRLRTG